ncbi:hypothetical protein L581_4270 [Serratia fonticola AU-AP2C]|nr:hypothetical protein L581_4270 [Serratia fonticola AU-AP2C]
MPAKSLIQQQNQPDYPAMKRGVVNNNTEFRHHFFKIAQAEGISQRLANALSDNIGRVMQATKGFSDQRYK